MCKWPVSHGSVSCPQVYLVWPDELKANKKEAGRWFSVSLPCLLSLLAPETAAVRADLAFVLLFSSLWSILKSFTFSHWVRLEGKTLNLMELCGLVWLDEQLLLFLLILTIPPVFCWCMVILYLILITIKLVAFLYFFLVLRPLGADKQKPKNTAGWFL